MRTDSTFRGTLHSPVRMRPLQRPGAHRLDSQCAVRRPITRKSCPFLKLLTQRDLLTDLEEKGTGFNRIWQIPGRDENTRFYQYIRLPTADGEPLSLYRQDPVPT